MTEKCQNCGKYLEYDRLTHCSNKCLFVEVLGSQSVSNNPLEKWASDDLI